MSLTVSNNGGGSNIPVLPEGSYSAVCNMLVDLGLQHSDTYNNDIHKVMIGWQIPDELIEIDGEKVPREIRKRYTASLNEKSILRKDLAAWRSRDFTDQELAEFNLRNIVGAPCLLQVIHKESGGKIYANISAVMSIPKGMVKPQMIGKPTVYDIDEDEPEAVNDLPEWMQEIIRGSVSWQERMQAKVNAESGDGGVELEELPDETNLPF